MDIVNVFTHCFDSQLNEYIQSSLELPSRVASTRWGVFCSRYFVISSVMRCCNSITMWNSCSFVILYVFCTGKK